MNVSPYEVGSPEQVNVNVTVSTNFKPQDMFRSHSVLNNCGSCGKVGPTNIDVHCSFSNYLCYCFFSNCWFCFNSIRRKDINCCDATHYCSSCGAQVGQYNAC